MLAAAALGGCATSHGMLTSKALPQASRPTVRIAGVTFVNARSQIQADCRAAARAIRYVVACATLVPSGWISSFFTPTPGNTERELFVKTQRRGPLARWTYLSLQDPTATVPSHLVMSSAPRLVTPWEFVCACPAGPRMPHPSPPLLGEPEAGGIDTSRRPSRKDHQGGRRRQHLREPHDSALEQPRPHLRHRLPRPRPARTPPRSHIRPAPAAHPPVDSGGRRRSLMRNTDTASNE